MTEYLVTVYNNNTMEIIDEFLLYLYTVEELKDIMSNLIHDYNIPYTDIYWVYEV